LHCNTTTIVKRFLFYSTFTTNSSGHATNTTRTAHVTIIHFQTSRIFLDIARRGACKAPIVIIVSMNSTFNMPRSLGIQSDVFIIDAVLILELFSALLIHARYLSLTNSLGVTLIADVTLTADVTLIADVTLTADVTLITDFTGIADVSSSSAVNVISCKHFVGCAVSVLLHSEGHRRVMVNVRGS
jgi:hypothetical protein